ncbi:MAG: M14 family metallopeptidase [Pyrinomonadaceae bacterium]
MKLKTRFPTALPFLASVILTFASLLFAQSDEGAVPRGWQTHAEANHYKSTPRYQETIEFSKRLDAKSRLIVYKSFGKSSEGRDLPLLIAASNGEFTVEKAKKSGKALILIQAAIHAGESDGKDAGLALLRDIAITGSRKELLRDAIILFIPIYNVDGHELFGPYNRINQNGPEEMGFRANSANQNLNRDYVKADTSETRAWLRLWNEWKPDLFIDCHVTDGADFQYNITWEYAHHQDAHPALREWMAEHFEKNVVQKVEKEGNLLTRYVQMIDPSEPGRGIVSFIATPRFATGYTPLRLRNGLLIEAHSVKDYRSRVRGTYDVLNHMIAEAGANRESLFAANRAAEAYYLDNPVREEVLSLKIGDGEKMIDFKGFGFDVGVSSVTGGKKLTYNREKVTYRIPQYDEGLPDRTVETPNFYLVPPQWREVIDLLDAHGVETSRFSRAKKLKVRRYRLKNPKWAAFPFEGRLNLSVRTEAFEEEVEFPKDTVAVPMRQVNSRVAVNILEPSAPDSAVFWGFFNAVFEQKEYGESYIFDQIAADLLAKDEDLRKRYEKALEDKDFAANPRARMRFLYENSPYYDQRIGVYPVGMLDDASVKLSELVQ